MPIKPKRKPSRMMKISHNIVYQDIDSLLNKYSFNFSTSDFVTAKMLPELTELVMKYKVAFYSR